MTRLAQTYIHIRPFSAPSEEVERLGNVLFDIVKFEANIFFQTGTVVDVELEEGSLKARISVAGILALYGLLADYKGFKESLSEIVSDSQKFSGFVAEKFLSSAQIPPKNVVRVERRTKTPGKLKRYLQKRDWFIEHSSQLSLEDRTKFENELDGELQSIAEDLPITDRNAILNLIGEKPTRRAPPEPSRLAVKNKLLHQEYFDAMESKKQTIKEKDYFFRQHVVSTRPDVQPDVQPDDHIQKIYSEAQIII